MFKFLKRPCYAILGTFTSVDVGKKSILMIGKSKFPSGTVVSNVASQSPNMLFYHYALYYNDIIYDFPSELGDVVGSKECSAIEFSENYHVIIKKEMNVTRDRKDIVYEESIKSFIRMWEFDHPEYNLLTDNCQIFVHDIALQVFDIEINTQYDEFVVMSNNVLKIAVNVGALVIVFGAVTACILRIYALAFMR